MSREGTAAGPAFREERLFLGAAAALYVWQLIWIGLSWPYMLDDSLIHLLYADNLNRFGRITYDGVHASFGTSSLLYVAMLAGLRKFSVSPLLPRVVSSVAYAALFPALFLALNRGLRGKRNVSAAIGLLSFGLLAVIVAPSAVRWLDDGMETGLEFLAALLGVLLLRRFLRPGKTSVWLGTAAFVYGLLTVLLRVELLALVALIALAAVVETREREEEQRRRQLLAVLPLLAGALAAAGLILFTMGALLPDTAYAKAFGFRYWFSTFETTGQTMLGSTSIGLGLCLLWLMSWAALRKAHRLHAADWLTNLFSPAMLLLAATRGQQIFFIRYFGWAVFFSALSNALRLADLPAETERAVPSFLRPVLIAFLLLLLPAFVWESLAFHRVFSLRNAAFQALRAQHLESLHGQLGIVEDIGFTGYFTHANLCDPHGLVNGRAAAKLDYDRRFARCMVMHPSFGFGSREFLQRMTSARSLAGWLVCGTYNFRNVREDDLHYLVVAPALVPLACPGRATPVAQAVPGLL